MKRILSIVAVLCFLCAVASGCNRPLDLTKENAAEKIIQISTDPTPYLGKEIRVAGYYTKEVLWDKEYHYVLLNSGGEENLGFEIRWEEESPEMGAPVIAIGTLMTETVFGQAYLYLKVSDLRVLTAVTEE